jgi:hypothetical protein
MPVPISIFWACAGKHVSNDSNATPSAESMLLVNIIGFSYFVIDSSMMP